MDYICANCKKTFSEHTGVPIEAVIAFLLVRLQEDEAVIRNTNCVAWLTFVGDDNNLRYTTVAHRDVDPDDEDYESDPWAANGEDLPVPHSVKVFFDRKKEKQAIAIKRDRIRRYLELLSERQHTNLVVLYALEREIREDATIYQEHPNYVHVASDVPCDKPVAIGTES